MGKKMEKKPLEIINFGFKQSLIYDNKNKVSI
jgi:hypothetical protein